MSYIRIFTIHFCHVIWFFESHLQLRDSNKQCSLPLHNILVTTLVFLSRREKIRTFSYQEQTFFSYREQTFFSYQGQTFFSYQWRKLPPKETLSLFKLENCIFVFLFSILNRNQSCDNETENMNDKIKSLVCSNEKRVSLSLLNYSITQKINANKTYLSEMDNVTWTSHVRHLFESHA